MRTIFPFECPGLEHAFKSSHRRLFVKIKWKSLFLLLLFFCSATRIEWNQTPSFGQRREACFPFRVLFYSSFKIYKSSSALQFKKLLHFLIKNWSISKVILKLKSFHFVSFTHLLPFLQREKCASEARLQSSRWRKRMERGVALFAHSLQTTENLFKMAFFATVKNDLYVNFLSKHFETFQTWTNLDSVLYSFKFTAFFSTSREMMMTTKKRCALFRGIALYHVLEDSVCRAHFVGRLYIFFFLRLRWRKVKRLEDANAFFAVIFSHILTPLFKSCWCCLDLLFLICSRDPYLFLRLLKCCLMHVNSLWREASPSMALFAPFFRRRWRRKI